MRSCDGFAPERVSSNARSDSSRSKASPQSLEEMEETGVPKTCAVVCRVCVRLCVCLRLVTSGFTIDGACWISIAADVADCYFDVLELEM